MKKIFVIILFLLPFTLSAQTFFEDFDANSLKWNTYDGKDYFSVIQQSMLHLESREDAHDAMVTTYTDLDPKKPFELEIKLMKTKLNDEQRGIGLVFNYKDDFNYDVFYLMKGSVLYRKVIENKIVRQRRGAVSYDTKIKDHTLTLKSTPNKFVFFVSGVEAMEIDYATLDYGGIGVRVWAEDGKQSADVDYIRYDQK